MVSNQYELEKNRFIGDHTEIILETITFEDGNKEFIATFKDNYGGALCLKDDEIQDFIDKFKEFRLKYKEINPVELIKPSKFIPFKSLE